VFPAPSVPTSGSAMLKVTLKASAVAAGAALAIGAIRYVVRRRAKARGFQATRVPASDVAEYELTEIDRDESGRVGGITAFDAVDTGRSCSFGELMQRKDTVLYTYDLKQRILIFMTVPDKAALWREPFLDRGVRKLASQAVFVCAFDVATQYLNDHKGALPDPAHDTFLFVWNTGRCGSTLLARLTSAIADSVTLSEPWWVDQLGQDKKVLEADLLMMDLLVKLLHVIDFHLARTLVPAATGKVLYSLNPKGTAAFLREPALRVFPKAKHLFMYRDQTKVVESFGSILGSSPAKARLGMVQMAVDKVIGGPVGAIPGSRRPVSRQLTAVSQDLKLPSKMMVKMFGLMWADAMLSWMEFTEDNSNLEVLTLRMDEFVTKDLVKRAVVVKTVLDFADVAYDAPGALDRAMAVFNTHSQAGSAMEKSSAKTGQKFLTEQDVQELHELCAQVVQIGKPSFVIPGSLGT